MDCESKNQNAPLKNVYAWSFKKDADQWQMNPEGTEFFAPPLQLNVTGKGWVTLVLSSQKEALVSIVWRGFQEEAFKHRNFMVLGDGRMRHYNIQIGENLAWTGDIAVFGLRLPSDAGIEIESIAIASDPSGPPEVETVYFGFENAPNRAGRICRVRAQFFNRGGTQADGVTACLILPPALRLVSSNLEQTLDTLGQGDYAGLSWEVLAEEPGDYPIQLMASLEGNALPKLEATLHFSKSLNLPKADYVPEPRPVETSVDVLAYYFPGWSSDIQWDCVRRITPVRKPMLGWYDEGNPECVDWQIKWAAENGIKCFLVDWYWTLGNQQFTHWLDAYRKARYRDHLKIALMWANHGELGMHTPEDTRKVLRFWIDNYFSLDSYYQIDGKPVVFIFGPECIRRDLGEAAVREIFDEAQQWARDAGFKGISFFQARGINFWESDVPAMIREGYEGLTTYHQWIERSIDLAFLGERVPFEEVVQRARSIWEDQEKMATGLQYFPVIDTGWDSRPWHGETAAIVYDRTPERFERKMLEARKYCEEKGTKAVVFGPVNEWGEGCYIEPCTEYGFDMYEAVRKVFGKGDPASWPVNVAPSDVGLGPYDHKQQADEMVWTFENHKGGWTQEKGVADLRLEDKTLRFRTTTEAPTISVVVLGMNTKVMRKIDIRMKLAGNVPAGCEGRLFWRVGLGDAASPEMSEVKFPVRVDGDFHTYTIDLREVPDWCGYLPNLFFTPCEASNVEVILDEFRLGRAEENFEKVK